MSVHSAPSDDLRQNDPVSPSPLKLRSSVSRKPEDIYESRLVLNSPDGGWGWMVCLGVFTANFILGGTIMSFGLILISLLNYFGESRSKTSWVGSVTDGMSLLAGPLVSLLLQKFTHRQVVICGTILASLGFIASIWMPNVDCLIFTYGFVAGTGIGMTFISANVIIVLYFTSKRALAVGIAMSGSGIGVFVYSFIVEALLQYYGWQGTILTMVGIILHNIICGALFRPLKWVLNKKYFSTSSQNSDASTDSGYKDNSDISLISTSTLNNDYFYKNITNRLEIPSHLKTAGNLSPARYHRKFSDGTNSIDKDHFSLSSDPNIFKTLIVPSPHHLDHHGKNFSPSSNLLHMRSKRLYDDPTLPSIFRGSSANLRCISMQAIGALYNSSILIDDKFEKATNSSENSSRSSSSSFNMSVFTDAVMVFLLIAMTLSTAQGAVITHLPSYAASLGISSVDVAVVVSVLGIMVSVGQLVVGLIVDFLYIPIIYAYSLAMVVVCSVVAVMPLVHSIYALSLCAAVFGFFVGWLISLRTILLADLVGVENLTHVFGIVAFFQGTGFIVYPPLAGLLFDKTQSYSALFMLCAASYGLAAMFTLILCYFYRKQDTPSNDSIYSAE